MDRHTHKRQYQPSITTYFPSSSPGYLLTTTERPRHHHAHVDQQTQSSLLSLGMRIRKAVPEGYKTHKNLLPTPTSSYPNTSWQSRLPTGNSRPKELAPLCGLFKVGGLAPQDFSLENDDGDVPDLTFESSQDSNFSIQTEQDVPIHDSLFGGPVGAFSTPKPKRRLDYDSDSDADDEREYDAQQKFLASPGMAFPGRVFARPRRRGVVSQNIMMEASTVEQNSEFDFEEASFLKGDWEGEIDGEVEMGGL